MLCCAVACCGVLCRAVLQTKASSARAELGKRLGVSIVALCWLGWHASVTTCQHGLGADQSVCPNKTVRTVTLMFD